MLSDKAQGKQRQQDDSDERNVVPPAEAPRTFTVRFSEGIPDLDLTVGPKDTVRQVQRQVSTRLHIDLASV